MLQRFKCRRQYCTINLKELQKPNNNQSSENNQNVEKGEDLSKIKNVEKLFDKAAITEQHQQYDKIKAQIRENTKKMFNKWQLNITSVQPENDVASEQILKRIMNNIEEFTHMKEVRLSQDYVKEVRTRLLVKNKEKRCLLKALDEVRTEINNTYREMKATNNRSPEIYLQLTHKEIELIQREKQLLDEFAIIDDAEQRILHYELSAAINDSYEKERIHTNFIKLLGLIFALLSSFLSFFGGVISYKYQQNRYKLLLKEVDSIVGRKVSETMANVNRLLIHLDEKNGKKKESWGSYIKRHVSWTYSWAWRKS